MCVRNHSVDATTRKNAKRRLFSSQRDGLDINILLVSVKHIYPVTILFLETLPYISFAKYGQPAKALT